MTNTIATPFVVRELRGRFVPSFTDDVRDWLHPQATIAFQLNGPNGRRIHVPVASDGRFQVAHLPAGRYCFHTSSDAFQGYDGVIIIDPRATEDFVTISVDLGV